MLRNKLMQQMLDVKPIKKTGRLDWEKIKSVGNSKIDYQEILRKKREQEEDQRRKFIEMEKRRMERSRKFLVEKVSESQKKEERFFTIKKSEKMKELEEREKLIREEAQRRQEYLRKLWQQNRELEEAYKEAVRSEREKRRRAEEAIIAEKIRVDETEMQKNGRSRDKRNEEPEHEIKITKISSGKEERKGYYVRKNSIWEDIFFFKDIFHPSRFPFQLVSAGKSMLIFSTVAIFAFMVIGSISYAMKGMVIKDKILGKSQRGYDSMNAAIADLAQQNFDESSQNFSKAFDYFSESSKEIENMGGILMDATRFVPYASKISSGKNAVEAGKHFSAAGKSLNEVVRTIVEIKNSESGSQKNDLSLLKIFVSVEKNIQEAKSELDMAQENVDKILIDDLPKEARGRFLVLKENLPEIRKLLDSFLNNSHIFADLLGGNGPRKYLFLFKNNSEMRPTGGFIGSYALLDISNGHVKNFFIDGIFNPDGQLTQKIVPPKPIQKISAAWSLHDSNWFPDFPTSARKAIMFYEKTGGPTADGVITFTPTILQKMLEITGPIEMPEYEVTVDSDNFIEVMQYEVEVDYDKNENNPKKILSDLAPIILEKIFEKNDIGSITRVAGVFMSGLKEKDILLFSQNEELQTIISKEGWSGEILPAAKDYISIINTNINGFKTDAMIEERIEHRAEIQKDGSIIDTVNIRRKHNGGNSEFEWFNKVNADYMRVYVPEGSKLLEVTGQTRENVEAPLDYDALGFKRDEDVEKEERNMSIDPQSGTMVYNEKGKTVFANWTYVSPQEEMVITYKYILPFSLFSFDMKEKEEIDSYSLVIQKQSGSFGSSFISHISYPSDYDVKMILPEKIQEESEEIKNETVLKEDLFEGVIFGKK